MRVVRPRREIDFMGIEFAEGMEGENQRARYAKLFNREVTPTRYPYETALYDLGLYNSVRWMLGNLRMSDFCAMISPTYVRLT